MWRLSAPQLDIQYEKELKSEQWDQGRRGEEGRDRGKRQIKKREKEEGEKGHMDVVSAQELDVNMLTGGSEVVPAGFE